MTHELSDLDEYQDRVEAPDDKPASPTNEQIMAVMELSAVGNEQFCQRLRDLFAGFDYFGQTREALNQRYNQATLEEMQAEVYEINVANGWFDDDRTFGDDVALLHSEVSEMFEAYRDYELSDATLLAQVTGTELPKPEGVGSEIADVLIRLLDTCTRHDINPRAELVRKLAYNRTRGYRHGGKSL